MQLGITSLTQLFTLSTMYQQQLAGLLSAHIVPPLNGYGAQLPIVAPELREGMRE